MTAELTAKFDLHDPKSGPALFTGTEQEGPRKGAFTLFVKGVVPLDVLENAVHEEQPDQFYFGAGMRSPWLHLQLVCKLKALRKQFPHVRFTYELGSLSELATFLSACQEFLDTRDLIFLTFPAGYRAGYSKEVRYLEAQDDFESSIEGDLSRYAMNFPQFRVKVESAAEGKGIECQFFACDDIGMYYAESNKFPGEYGGDKLIWTQPLDLNRVYL